MPPAKTRTRKKAPTPARTPGRPSPIDAVIGHREGTGEPITVAERIVASIRAGNYFEPAAAAAGITKITAYEWLKVAGHLRLRARGRPVTTLDPAPSAHELRCLEFSNAVDEAQAIWEVGANTQLEQLARGGLEVVTTTVKTLASGDVETTVKTEKLAPNAQVIEWRLTRKFPARYGERIQVDGRVDGRVEFTVAERAQTLAGDLAAYLAGHDAGQATTIEP